MIRKHQRWGRPVTSTGEPQKLVGQAGKQLAVLMQRGKEEIFLTVRLD